MMETAQLLDTINEAECVSRIVQVCEVLHLCLWALHAILLTEWILFFDEL